MSHDSDIRVATFLAQEEQKQRLWHSHGMPGLGTVREELFGDSEVPDCNLKYELTFWSLRLRGSPGDWGTYYSPSVCEMDGKRYEYPQRSEITEACLDYWELRATTSQHPLLRARYADAVWDLKKGMIGKSLDFKLLRSAITDYRDAIINDRIEPPGWHHDILARLFYLCTSTGQSKELESTFNDLFNFCQKPGTSREDDSFVYKIKNVDSQAPTADQLTSWAERDFFRSIMQLEKKHWVEPVTPDLARNLRQRLDHSPLDKGARYARQDLAIPLAHYYWKTNSREDAHAVLLKYGEAVEDNAAATPALHAVGALQHLAKLFESYEMHEDKDRVRGLIEQRQEEIPGQLRRVDMPIEIAKDEADEWADSILKLDLPGALREIAVSFMPTKASSRKSMEDVAKSAPVLTFLTKATVDSAGRTTSVVASDDEDGRLMAHYIHQFKIDDVFLQILLPRFVESFQIAPQTLVPPILASDLWVAERHAMVDIGVQAFFHDNFLVSLHLLVPQIESAIREVARSLGVSLQKPNRYGGNDLRNINDLLVDEAVRDHLSDDLTFYLRAVLCDQRGWNIRNNLCHGIAKANELDGTAARRVFLIVLLLSHLRLPTSGKTPEQGGGGGC